MVNVSTAQCLMQQLPLLLLMSVMYSNEKYESDTLSTCPVSGRQSAVSLASGDYSSQPGPAGPCDRHASPVLAVTWQAGLTWQRPSPPHMLWLRAGNPEMHTRQPPACNNTIISESYLAKLVTLSPMR